jgi:hypothetical protein
VERPERDAQQNQNDYRPDNGLNHLAGGVGVSNRIVLDYYGSPGWDLLHDRCRLTNYTRLGRRRRVNGFDGLVAHDLPFLIGHGSGSFRSEDVQNAVQNHHHGHHDDEKSDKEHQHH